MSDRLVIHEIFTSLQGETTEAGRPCTFIRLTGCNLRCVYCDTAYAFHGGEERDLEDIAAEVARRGIRFVTVTGGEPLAQRAVHPLIRRLLDDGHEVQIETGGSLPTRDVDPRARVILDIKTPGSGMAGSMDWETVARVRSRDQVKFVLVDRRDYEFARAVIREGRIPAGAPILLSPAHGSLDPKDLARWMIEDNLPARLQLQIHKYIWGSDARGV